MPDRRRTVFFVSDGTGITVEMLGHSLLTQFDGIDFNQETVPFVDSIAKAEACVARVNGAPRPAGFRPVVFTTLVNADIRETVRKADAFVLDFFQNFLDPLEAEFGSKSTHTIGRSHSARDAKGYTHRIGDQFCLGARRRRLLPGPRQGGCHPRRRVAQRQDADQSVPVPAVRHPGGELPPYP